MDGLEEIADSLAEGEPRFEIGEQGWPILVYEAFASADEGGGEGGFGEFTQATPFPVSVGD